MTTETYNGWVNRETWAVNLWLTNDQGLYETCQDMAREAIKDSKRGYPRRDPRFILADALRDFVDELKETENPSRELRSMFDDIGSAWRVKWEEVADAFLEGETDDTDTDDDEEDAGEDTATAEA